MLRDALNPSFEEHERHHSQEGISFARFTNLTNTQNRSLNLIVRPESYAGRALGTHKRTSAKQKPSINQQPKTILNPKTPKP